MPAPVVRWDRASRASIRPHGDRRPEIVSLPAGLPDVPTLFTFMRDAELRFSTLRMRIDERTGGTAGTQHVTIETLIRHPGFARVTTSERDRATANNYRTWVSDGTTVRTYSAISNVATERPVRRRIVGLHDPDLPGRSKVYTPVTQLPTESLPDVFVHPAGFCQNVLATGSCAVAGWTTVAGREAIVVECDHPRTTLVYTDRPDHALSVAVDAQLGIITRLVETIGDQVTRDAEATSVDSDAALPASAFDVAVPSNAAKVY